jgi:23S rRNA (uracil1939-C5)-methyltransferase
MRDLSLTAWDGRSGLLRHAGARRARTGEVILTLVATAPEPRLAQLAERLMAAMPELRAVALSLHDGQGNRVLGGQAQMLAGEGEIEETILGLRFRVGPTSFFQVHPAAAERLFATVLAWAGAGEGREALDLYTGVGVLALLLQRAGYQVRGIEYDEEAVSFARRNAQLNALAASFVPGDAQEADMPAPRALLTLDPPRGGAPRLAERLAADGPERVIYVSCDPATLARDAATLVAGGYSVGRVQPFDLFPRTAHVETVAEFLR